MLNVFVCEDNTEQRNMITKTVKNIIMIEELSMQFILATGNPHELIECISKEPKTGLYFLDVDLGCDMSGIVLAENIRKMDSRGFIVFITTHDESLSLTFQYRVEAMDFILKDDFEQIGCKLRSCLFLANERFDKASVDIRKSLPIKSFNQTELLPFEDITCIETVSPHKIAIRTKKRRMEIFKNLKDVEKELNKRFVKCHRGIIVNVDQIEHIDKNNLMVKLKDGSECIASRLGIRKIISMMK